MLIDYAKCELFDDLQVRDIETGAVAVLLMISGYGQTGSQLAKAGDSASVRRLFAVG